MVIYKFDKFFGNFGILLHCMFFQLLVLKVELLANHLCLVDLSHQGEAWCVTCLAKMNK